MSCEAHDHCPTLQAHLKQAQSDRDDAVAQVVELRAQLRCLREEADRARVASEAQVAALRRRVEELQAQSPPHPAPTAVVEERHGVRRRRRRKKATSGARKSVERATDSSSISSTTADSAHTPDTTDTRSHDASPIAAEATGSNASTSSVAVRSAAVRSAAAVAAPDGGPQSVARLVHRVREGPGVLQAVAALGDLAVVSGWEEEWEPGSLHRCLSRFPIRLPSPEPLEANAPHRKAVRRAGGLVVLARHAVSPCDDRDPEARLLRCLVLRALAWLAYEEKCCQGIGGMGAIPALVSCLDSAWEDVKVTALWTLVNVVVDPDNRAAVRRAGGVPRLILCLASDALEVQRRAAWVLVHMAVTEPCKEAIHGASGVRSLVRCLSSQAAAVQHYAAWVLANLAADNDQRQDAIRAAGGVRRLVACLGSDSDEVRHCSAWVLCHLLGGGTGGAPGRVEVREAGGVSALVACLLVHSLAVQATAARALANAMWDDGDNCDAVLQAGGVEPLVACCRRAGDDAEGDRDAVLARNDLAQNATFALRTLAASRAAADAVAAAAGVPALTALLAPSLSAGVQRQAAWALARLCDASDTCAAAVCGDALDALGACLSRGDGELQQHAVAAVRVVVARGSPPDTAYPATMLQGLVCCLRATDMGTRLAAAHALGGVIKCRACPDAAVACVTAGAVDGFVGCLREAADACVAGGDGMHAAAPMVHAGASALGALVTHAPDLAACAQRQHGIRTAGGIGALVVALNAACGAEARQSALSALMHIVDECPSNEEALCDAGGIPALVQCLGERRQPALRQAAAWLLVGVSANVANQDALRVAGCIPRLCTCLQDLETDEGRDGVADSDLRHCVVVILGNVTWRHAANRGMVMLAGGVGALVHCLRVEDCQLQESTAVALAHLMTERDGVADDALCDAVVAVDGVAALGACLQSQWEAVARAAMTAVLVLADCDRHRLVIRDTCVMPLFPGHPSTEAQRLSRLLQEGEEEGDDGDEEGSQENSTT